jgi:uncharacterized protein (TIGR03083 family)
MINLMNPVQPIQTVELFPPLSRELLSVVKSLDKHDWYKTTACELWSVKDVVAHLLGGNLGRLVEKEDQSGQAENIALSFEELVSLINQENEDWVRAARRINISLLIKLLEKTDKQLYQKFKNLPMDELADTPVSWAGEAQSPNWMDIAREYTEKWLHQQHIREAVGRPLLTSRKWLYPVLDVFMRALSYTYLRVEAKDGVSLSVYIEGEAGGVWWLYRENGTWRLYSGSASGATVSVRMDQDLAWRLFTKGVSPEVARSQVYMDGDWNLGAKILQMVSIMA